MMDPRQVYDKRTALWGESAIALAVTQIAASVEKITQLKVRVASDGSGFRSEHSGGRTFDGIWSAAGELVADSTIVVKLEVLQAPGDSRVSVFRIFERLSQIHEKSFLFPPTKIQGTDCLSLCVGLRVQALPLSAARLVHFESILEKIHSLAKTLRSELPVHRRSNLDLAKLYRPFEGCIEPLHPAQPKSDAMVAWAERTLELLQSGLSVGLSSPYPILEDYALAVLASIAENTNWTLGRLALPAVAAKALADLAKKAPGTLAVPAICMSLGMNPYEMANEIRSLLRLLSTAGTPVLFTGTFSELQTVFNSGQGSANDPLQPVVRRAPPPPLEDLTQLAIQSAAPLVGGLPKNVETDLTQQLWVALQDCAPARAMRILPAVANQHVRNWANSGTSPTPADAATFVHFLGRLKGTFGDLSVQANRGRDTDFQDELVRELTDSDLLSYFREHLLGQDRALAQLVSRLRTEALTRPAHQPLRWCAQGTPGIGKSESARLLARRLGIVYEYVDAASFSDHYTANAQMRGSGRGLVGSNQPGRLECAAKQHGALLEIADLDHAPLSVRSALSEMFLQVLENGEAQSATGATFSCANLILVFTMNLPGGVDESIRKGFGFNRAPSRQQVEKRAMSEVKKIFSSAFLSRVGTPILFEPLDSEALGLIVEKAVRAAFMSAAKRLHIKPEEILIEPGLGAGVLKPLETNLVSMGARRLLEHARSLVAKALVAFRQTDASSPGKLRVTVGENFELAIVAEETSSIAPA